MLYGIVVWGNVGKTLLTPIHLLQKKLSVWQHTAIVTLSLDHLPIHLHSFFKLKILNIFDIYKLQLGKLVQSVNVIGPACKVIKFNLASELHCHNTRLCYVSSVRTTRFGLKDLKIEGAKL